MHFTKKHLCDLPFCYAVTQIQLDGRTQILMAPDAYGPCFSFDTETLEKETVWEGPSGTMGMVQLPGRNGDFLAVQRFNPGFQAQEAEIVYVHRVVRGWQVKTLLKLPYVHRFDILQRAGLRYLVCFTVCTSKKNEEDWSSPGGIYAAQLSDDFSQPVALDQIGGGMTRNHGYWRVQNEGYTSALSACDQGVFEVLPPDQQNGKWTLRNILAKPVSDIALCDIDGDGVDELAAIEPFHGTDFVIYHKTEEGYTPVYRYPQKLAFCHVVWGGRLRGQPVFIGGCRAGNQELFLLRNIDGSIQSETIEIGSGPSNVTVVRDPRQDLIAVANRGTGQGALFVVRDS
jgi:hypothetical protein